jgi:hypothetical protein
VYSHVRRQLCFDGGRFLSRFLILGTIILASCLRTSVEPFFGVPCPVIREMQTYSCELVVDTPQTCLRGANERKSGEEAFFAAVGLKTAFRIPKRESPT